MLLQNSKGTPSAGALNTRGVGKFAIFDRKRHLSRQRYEIGPQLLLEIICSRLTLSDLERPDVRGQF